MACGKQKGKGGNGSITASSSASSSASIIPLNLGVGCAPSCWPIFGFRPSWVLAGGSEGSFLCSLSSRFSGRGGGGGEPPQGVAASWGASVGERKNKNCQNPRVDPCLSFTLLGSPTSRSFCFSEYNVKFDESRPHFL